MLHINGSLGSKAIRGAVVQTTDTGINSLGGDLEATIKLICKTQILATSHAKSDSYQELVVKTPCANTTKAANPDEFYQTIAAVGYDERSSNLEGWDDFLKLLAA